MRRAPLLLAHCDQRHVGGGERMLLTVARRARRQTAVELMLLHGGATRTTLTGDPVFAATHELDAPRELVLRSAAPLVRSLRQHAALLAGRRACLSFSWPAAVRTAIAARPGGARLAWMCQEELALVTLRRRAALRLLARRGTRVVCPCDNVARQLASLGYPRSLLTTIRNGVDVAWFRPADLAPDERAALRRRLGLRPEATLVVCPARFDGNKRQDTLIAAVARLGAAADVELVCAGEEHADARGRRAALQRLAAALGVADRVRLLPHHADVRPLLAASDVVALASREEAAPLVLVEAAASGRALLTTRAGGNAEVVRDGVTGFLFEAGDVDGCARRLAELAAAPALREALGRGARELAVNKFASTAMHAGWDAFVADLLR